MRNFRSYLTIHLIYNQKFKILWSALFIAVCFAVFSSGFYNGGLVQKDDQMSGSIFFIETSGQSCLTRRQVCSIESAALTNPQTAVRIFFVQDPPRGSPSASKFGSGNPEFRDCSATNSLLTFPNVVFHNNSFTDLLQGSILQDWFFKGAMNQSIFPIFHASDALRIAILKRYGGIYLDMDCLVMRSLEDLVNTAGMKHSRWIENGVLSFEANHPFLSFYEQIFTRDYGYAGYDQNGPRLMTTALLNFCNVTDFFARVYTCNNSSITIRPADDFYLIDFDHRTWFYNNTFPRHLDEVLLTKYLTHVYENDDGIHIAYPGSLFANLAQQLCPRTYEKSIEKTGYF